MCCGDDYSSVWKRQKGIQRVRLFGGFFFKFFNLFLFLFFFNFNFVLLFYLVAFKSQRYEQSGLVGVDAWEPSFVLTCFQSCGREHRNMPGVQMV